MTGFFAVPRQTTHSKHFARRVTNAVHYCNSLLIRLTFSINLLTSEVPAVSSSCFWKAAFETARTFLLDFQNSTHDVLSLQDNICCLVVELGKTNLFLTRSATLDKLAVFGSIVTTTLLTTVYSGLQQNEMC